MHVKRPLTQFTCVTCSLPVKIGKFTRVYAASTSRRIQANCQQPHVNLPEYKEYFTGNFTCGTHANLAATSMQKCLLLQAKRAAIAGKNILNCGQKYPQLTEKIRANALKKTRNSRHYCYHTAGKITCQLQVRLHPAG